MPPPGIIFGVFMLFIIWFPPPGPAPPKPIRIFAICCAAFMFMFIFKFMFMFCWPPGPLIDMRFIGIPSPPCCIPPPNCACCPGPGVPGAGVPDTFLFIAVLGDPGADMGAGAMDGYVADVGVWTCC